MAETEQTGGTGIQRPGQAGASINSSAADKALAMASAMQARLMAMPAGKRTWLIASASVCSGDVCRVALVCRAAGLASLVHRAGRERRAAGCRRNSRRRESLTRSLLMEGGTSSGGADGQGAHGGRGQGHAADGATAGLSCSINRTGWAVSLMNSVNYQRALEGELEHTIGTLAVVRSARVHLVLPAGLRCYGRGEGGEGVGSAATEASFDADPEQADAIRSLVAGSVENLSPET